MGDHEAQSFVPRAKARRAQHPGSPLRAASRPSFVAACLLLRRVAPVPAAIRGRTGGALQGRFPILYLDRHITPAGLPLARSNQRQHCSGQRRLPQYPFPGGHRGQRPFGRHAHGLYHFDHHILAKTGSSAERVDAAVVAGIVWAAAAARKYASGQVHG